MKIITLYYADTRPRFKPTHLIPNNEMIKLNYEQMWKYTVDAEHHFFLNHHVRRPCMDELLAWLRARSVTVHITPAIITSMKHPFNGVVRDSYDRVGIDHILNFDYVYNMQHDAMLINFGQKNALAWLAELLGDPNPWMAHRQQAEYDSVTHWIAAAPSGPPYFQHCAAMPGQGLYRAELAPDVYAACCQDEMHAECYTYRVQGHSSLYMKKNWWLYMGDYAPTWLNDTRLAILRRCYEDREAARDLFELAGAHVRGSAHSFLAGIPLP